MSVRGSIFGLCTFVLLWIDVNGEASGPAALAVSSKLQHVWSMSELLGVSERPVSLLFVTIVISDKC